VAQLLFKFRRIIETHDLAVDPSSCEPLRREFDKHVLILALAATKNRSQNLEPSSFFELLDSIHNLLCTLGLNGFATHRAVLNASPREQQSQIVIDLGHCSHSRPRVAVSGLLID